ncbi:MAG: class I SAM-dependent methyltransferase [Pseudomonadaceae bacterium]|nr:class I SAM-dependent methyltransferase [Pseudomonadaceae bacterium]
MKLSLDPDLVKGFLDPDEGARLYALACEVSPLGPCLEVGSYCGKSTVYLGSACQSESGLLFALDHHRGSEEHQRGEEYHDPELYDEVLGLMDTLPALRRTLVNSNLEDCVVPLVGSSALVGRFWQIPLSLVFIDGGHSLESALIDYRTWSTHIVSGGILAIHDIFPDPSQGGQAPYTIYNLAVASGLFEALPGTKTLGVLRRI